jgi:hypothetical protein
MVGQVVANDAVSGIAVRLVERPEGRRLFDLLRAKNKPLLSAG